MATKPKTRANVQFDINVEVVTWDLLAGDDGDPLEMAGSSDRTIHFSGVFGGATVVLEGSNNGGASYVTLTDPQGNAITKTGEAIEAVTELTGKVRPKVTGGDGTTAIKASLLIKR